MSTIRARDKEGRFIRSNHHVAHSCSACQTQKREIKELKYSVVMLNQLMNRHDHNISNILLEKPYINYRIANLEKTVILPAWAIISISVCVSCIVIAVGALFGVIL